MLGRGGEPGLRWGRGCSWTKAPPDRGYDVIRAPAPCARDRYPWLGRCKGHPRPAPKHIRAAAKELKCGADFCMFNEVKAARQRLRGHDLKQQGPDPPGHDRPHIMLAVCKWNGFSTRPNSKTIKRVVPPISGPDSARDRAWRRRTAMAKLRVTTHPREDGRSHRWTRPLESPFTSASTSLALTRLKSPGTVCLSAEAATANSSACSSS